jgi:flagellar basal body-associated protein FliL
MTSRPPRQGARMNWFWILLVVLIVLLLLGYFGRGRYRA